MNLNTDASIRKLNVDQVLAAAIMASVEKKLVISPKAVADVSQKCKIKMALDERGDFVLTVEE